MNMELKGKYATAIVYAWNVEQGAMSQIIEMCNQEFAEGSKIRIMPDVHAGAGCVIGTTMTIKEKVVPNLVGVDIGCGMYVVKIGNQPIDLEKLDCVVNSIIPAGFEVRHDRHEYANMINLEELRCRNSINMERAILSIGTLGGGNHFIELNKDDEGCFYLVVHSGSRNAGKQVAEHYQNLAYQEANGKRDSIQEMIKTLKNQGREREIQSELANLKIQQVRKDLAWLEGESLSDYLHDMAIMQRYASLNRKAIAHDILKSAGLWQRNMESFETVHNYIDVNKMILRKGAVSAEKDEILLIPINMRDGSLLCKGKGNDNWNRSAPHGAGRLMSRSEAKSSISMSEFEKSMVGIYTTSVKQSTLDECPMAYKPMEEIINNTKDTIEILSIIKPVYNYKSGG